MGMGMDVDSLLAQARDAMTVKRVFGEPIEREGVTVIPVANVMGGFGGGRGDPRSEGNGGSGGGFGVRATPAGVYVIEHGRVRWEPALNLNAVILGGQLVGIVMFLALRRLAGVFLEQRSTRWRGIRGLTPRAEHEPPWARSLARVRGG
jgi:uncharacterized spore protein YtfJ